MSELLSPIDLKESNRDISKKLDDLYKSYETKEKIFGEPATKLNIFSIISDSGS